MPGNPIEALAIRASRPDDALKISESLLFSIAVLSAKDQDLLKFRYRYPISLCILHRVTGVTTAIALGRFEPSVLLIVMNATTLTLESVK